ncbi:MAG: hypothetical protein WAN74_00815 [Thermoplasmata archaeon]
MGSRSEHRALSHGARVLRALTLILCALAILGIASAAWSSPVGGISGSRAIVSLPSAQNDSSSGDPSGSGALCPSAGPVIIGIEWNCVAVLNLTELALILASIGIVAYVFKDADRAELPGDSAEVPVTLEEWEEYRRARKQGIPDDRPEPPGGDGER